MKRREITSRERVMTTLAHHTPDRVPVCLAYETPKGLCERYGKPFDALLFRQDAYPVLIDLSGPHPSIRPRYLGDIPNDAKIDPWGVATWRSSTGDTFAVHGPLQKVNKAAELEDFPFPEVPDAASPEPVERVTALHRDGFAVQGAMSQTIFELAWNMCGMERLFVAFVENPHFVHRLLDEITMRKRTMAERFAEAGVDILRIGDDVGTQNGMMMSPRLWREFLKPRLASIIAAAKAIRPGLPVFYHSDGNILEIIHELVEIGVTILNPVQPECMDPFEIKRRYGEQLTLWGTIGTQSLLPFGTTADVRRVVGEYIERLGRDGGYVIGPTHSINRDVPWENIVAFYEAVRDFG